MRKKTSLRRLPLFTTLLLACAVDAAQVYPLNYSSDNEPWSYRQVTINYLANANGTYTVAPDYSNSSLDVGRNTTRVPFTAVVDGNIYFGPVTSSAGQGVPWDDVNGNLLDGQLKGFGMDGWSGAPGAHKAVIQFAAPVSGVKFAIADIDAAGEAAEVESYSSGSATTPLPVTVQRLANPSAIPALAQGAAHAGNIAYVVDPSKVSDAPSGQSRMYSVASPGGVTDSTATVLFAYDDNQPVQRIEVTYYSTTGTGITISGLTFNLPSATDIIGNAAGGSVLTVNNPVLTSAEGNGIYISGLNGTGCAVPCSRTVAGGTLNVTSSGYTFTPAPGFSGLVTIPYAVTDVAGQSVTANILIDVAAAAGGDTPPGPKPVPSLGVFGLAILSVLVGLLFFRRGKGVA